ncbi:hypothetical protein ABIA30_003625 [Mycobacterium sp. MAA66]|uniref:hypothetical protein n=1 Tax=Mycobacterium sp. MAA66 TaxID=3156297 RepID=UPI0035191CB5
MSWLNIWWHDEVVYGYKGPLLLSFTAFIVTFISTRTITRMIRAGKGPFHDIDNGGVHMHHSTPGVLILILGAFMAVGSPPQTVWIYVSGVFVGIGASLVLDEFAMLFRLQDVYWSQEGQLSLNVVTLAAGCVGLAAVGISPVKLDRLADVSTAARVVATTWLGIHLAFVVITALKGKYPTALIGLFFGPVTWFGAIRLARPTSPWARKRYSPEKLERARQRAAAIDDRWGPVRQRWDSFIGGTPTTQAVDQRPNT